MGRIGFVYISTLTLGEGPLDTVVCGSSKFVFYGSREPTQKMITKEREQQRRPRLIQFCFSCTNFVGQASTESGRFELQASSVTTKKSPNVYKK